MTTPLTPEQQALVNASSPAAHLSPEEQGKAPERVIVQPARESRLESLLCLYEQKKTAAQDAERTFKELKSAIAAELETLYSDLDKRPTQAYEIPGTVMYPPLVLQYKESWYLPVDSIRDNLPNVYEAFKKRKVYQELRESQAGKGRRPRGK